MLVLSRKPTEKIQIGESVFVTVLAICGNKVRLGIDAPKDIPILRSELQTTTAKSLAAVVIPPAVVSIKT